MANLGVRFAQGALSASNKITAGGWVATWRTQVLPADADFEVYHGALRGPGGYFEVYLDDQLYDVGENGRINAYEPNIAMYVRKGQEITMHWSIATGSAPMVWLYLRQPEVGRL